MERGVGPTGKIRVLVVDDSVFMRDMIKALLARDPGITVVGEAGNGRDAIAAVAVLKPDIVTMDIEMPIMGGLEAIEEIIATKALPILVITTLSDAQTAFDAIAKGALDLVLKSELRAADGRSFCKKIKLLASIQVITRSKRNGTPLSRQPESMPAGSAARQGGIGPAACRVIAIASSTGGPAALAYILARLPKELAVPILIAQHIAMGFTKGMVGWLDALSPLSVRLAAAGAALEPGTVYVAPSEHHMSVGAGRRIELSEPAPGDIHHPSCDRLLLSVAEVYGAEAAGIILTGMGRDGAAGMQKIFAAGGCTVAEDQSTSVVFGMNQAAISGGSIRKVLPLPEIPGEICRLAGTGSRAGGGAQDGF